ncbi:hypothetical protein ABIA96_001821 [Bradyrhizobium sp. LB11.1]
MSSRRSRRVIAGLRCRVPITLARESELGPCDNDRATTQARRSSVTRASSAALDTPRVIPGETRTDCAAQNTGQHVDKKRLFSLISSLSLAASLAGTAVPAYADEDGNGRDRGSDNGRDHDHGGHRSPQFRTSKSQPAPPPSTTTFPPTRSRRSLGRAHRASAASPRRSAATARARSVPRRGRRPCRCGCNCASRARRSSPRPGRAATAPTSRSTAPW